MSTIVAGGFQALAEAEEAVRRLQDAGVHVDYICTFRVNPAVRARPARHRRRP